MKGSRRVLAGAGSNWLRFLVTALVSFWLVPYMAHVFGSERYGLWALASSILGLLQALDAGFGAGTVKWTAEVRTPEEGQKRNELLSTSLAVHVLAALVGSVLVLALLLPFPVISGAGDSLAAEGWWVFLFLGLRVTLAGLPAGFLRGVLFGSDRLLLLNGMQIFFSVLYGIVSFWLLSSGAGPVPLAGWGLAVGFMELLALALATALVAKGFQPALSLRFSYLSRARFREALSFSGASFSIQIAGAVLMQSDLLLLRVFVPLPVIAGYGIAMKAAEYAFILVKQAVNALTPPIARLDPQKEPLKAKFIVINASKYAGALAVCFSVSSWVLGRDFLLAWAGPEYQSYWYILAVLTTAFVILAVQMPCAAYLSLKGHHAWAAKAMVASALVNVAASLVWGWFFKDLGIALGTLTASFIVDGLVLPAKAYRSLGIPIKELPWRVWARFVLPGGLQAGALLFMARMWPGAGMAGLLGMGAAGALVFGAAFFMLSMDHSERSLFLPFLKRRPEHG